jgi:hypothetical protein
MTAWTEERVEILREMWLNNKTAGQISIRLGTTRNAVIGKAFRLNLRRRPSPLIRKKRPMTKNISAHTAAGSQYPEYISVNNHEKGVSIVVRGPVRLHDNFPAAGEVVEIILSHEDFTKFLTDAIANYVVVAPADPNQEKFDV